MMETGDETQGTGSGGLARRSMREAVCALSFYTRLPFWRLPVDTSGVHLGRMQWAAPVAGIVVGLLLGAVNAALLPLGLPDMARGAIVVAVGLLLTGCLHEDGLGDVADGFGGGFGKERKLAIMKDSRVGTYGALALCGSFVLRAALVGAIAEPVLGIAALVAAHAGARALMAPMLHVLPPSRGDGISWTVGDPGRAAVVTALAIGLVALLLAGLPAALASALALAAAFGAMSWLSYRQIGGQVGDVCGATEQVGEMVVLIVLVAVLA